MRHRRHPSGLFASVIFFNRMLYIKYLTYTQLHRRFYFHLPASRSFHHSSSNTINILSIATIHFLIPDQSPYTLSFLYYRSFQSIGLQRNLEKEYWKKKKKEKKKERRIYLGKGRNRFRPPSKRPVILLVHIYFPYLNYPWAPHQIEKAYTKENTASKTKTKTKTKKSRHSTREFTILIIYTVADSIWY